MTAPRFLPEGETTTTGNWVLVSTGLTVDQLNSLDDADLERLWRRMGFLQRPPTTTLAGFTSVFFRRDENDPVAGFPPPEEATNQPFNAEQAELNELAIELEEFASNLGSELGQLLAQQTTRIDAAVGDIEEGVGGGLVAATNAILGLSTDLSDRVLSGISQGIDTIADVADGIQRSIDDFAQDTLGKIQTRTSSVLKSIDDGIGGVLAHAEGTLGGVQETVQGALDATLGSVSQVVDGVGDKVTGAIDGFTSAIEESVAPALQTVAQSVPLQIGSLLAPLETASEALSQLPQTLADPLQSVLGTLIESVGLDKLVDMFNVVGRLGSLLSAVPEVIPEQGSFRFGDVEVTDPQKSLVLFGSIVPFVGQALQLVHAGVMQEIQQDSFQLQRPALFTPTEALEILRRFPNDIGQLQTDLQRAGYSDEKIGRLFSLRHQLVNSEDTLNAWRRGLIDDNELQQRLDALGFQRNDQPILEQISEVIPPIQDLILFSVREVFNVQSAVEFGQFEGIPDDVRQRFVDRFGGVGADFEDVINTTIAEASKLGLPPEWVTAYWASHWRLPGLNSIYEMFQRLSPDIVEAERADFEASGFDPNTLAFDERQLDVTIRAQDFSPIWRDKLKAIAFRPLTRVDIRRMHALGILDDAAVERAYRKIGFSPSDAGKMLEFTRAFNAEPDPQQLNEVRELTRAQILDLVEHEIITPDEGTQELQDIGYDEFAASAFVDIELVKKERSLQRTSINLITEQLENGLISYNDAAVELDDLGLPHRQKQTVLREMELKLAKRTRNPTKTDLAKMLGKDIISLDDYRQGMSALGYNDQWIEHFIELVNAGETDI